MSVLPVVTGGFLSKLFILMYSIVIKIDPAKLLDANLDMRYALPDLIAERSGNFINPRKKTSPSGLTFTHKSVN